MIKCPICRRFLNNKIEPMEYDGDCFCDSFLFAEEIEKLHGRLDRLRTWYKDVVKGSLNFFLTVKEYADNNDHLYDLYNIVYGDGK